MLGAVAGDLGRGNKHIADRVKQQLFSHRMNEWMADDAQVCVWGCVSVYVCVPTVRVS